MKKSTKKPGGWSAVRREVATWDAPALLALVKDLYESAAANRDFIEARCAPADGGGDALEAYRSKIVEQFYPLHGFGKLELGEARKAIRDYRKATGNVSGTAELLMPYVENGTAFTREYGDIDERFYSSLESALGELAALLRGEAREMYALFASRLERVAEMASYIGWGFGDSVGDVVGELKKEMGDR